MNFSYVPQGVCPRLIEFELDGNIVRNVRFTGGCSGNLKAISKLIDGMDYKDVAKILKGNTCGLKDTSCADQLTSALEQAASKQQ